MKKGFLYPLSFKGTIEAFTMWRELSRQYKDCEVIDLVDLDCVGGVVSELACKECMAVLKNLVFKKIEGLDEIIIWAPTNTCYIKCIMHKTAELDIPMQLLSQTFDEEFEYENLTLKDYHYVEFSTEVE